MARRISPQLISTKKIWLICEGEKTEKNYFEGFRAIERIQEISIRFKDTNKTDPIGLVKDAIAHKKSLGKNYFQRDEFFCIFDRDNHQDKALETAVNLAKKNNINLIFSNPCFEYWILCHFEKKDSPCDIINIINKLKKYLGEYKKNDPNIYNKTKAKINTAIINSKEVLRKNLNAGKGRYSRDNHPSSNVHDLIEPLLKKKTNNLL